MSDEAKAEREKWLNVIVWRGYGGWKCGARDADLWYDTREEAVDYAMKQYEKVEAEKQ